MFISLMFAGHHAQLRRLVVDADRVDPTPTSTAASSPNSSSTPTGRRSVSMRCARFRCWTTSSRRRSAYARRCIILMRITKSEFEVEGFPIHEGTS